jgi:hypothetical protein
VRMAPQDQAGRGGGLAGTRHRGQKPLLSSHGLTSGNVTSILQRGVISIWDAGAIDAKAGI